MAAGEVTVAVTLAGEESGVLASTGNDVFAEGKDPDAPEKLGPPVVAS